MHVFSAVEHLVEKLGLLRERASRRCFSPKFSFSFREFYLATKYLQQEKVLLKGKPLCEILKAFSTSYTFPNMWYFASKRHSAETMSLTFFSFSSSLKEGIFSSETNPKIFRLKAWVKSYSELNFGNLNERNETSYFGFSKR